MAEAVDKFGEETMTKVKVYGNIKHNGKMYQPGDTIEEISVKDAERLKEQGLLDGEAYQAREKTVHLMNATALRDKYTTKAP